ncbi:MAG: flagellar basal body L-ring protein FlgH [Myxococcota bacterium]
MRGVLALILGAALGVAAFLSTGCAEIPGITQSPPPLAPPPVSSRKSYTPAEGSLWSGETSRRFLAFESRAKRVGDLVTVVIDESASAKNEAQSEIDRESKIKATLSSDIALQTLITKPIRTLLGLLGLAEQKNTSNPPAGSAGKIDIATGGNKTEFDGAGKLRRQASFTTTIACLVTDVSDSGLLRIEGERQLRLNNETQIITLSGWVRPEDVRLDNSVPSMLIASANIQYHGVGLVSEVQRAPWLTRLFNLWLPF